MHDIAIARFRRLRIAGMGAGAKTFFSVWLRCGTQIDFCVELRRLNWALLTFTGFSNCGAPVAFF